MTNSVLFIKSGSSTGRPPRPTRLLAALACLCLASLHIATVAHAQQSPAHAAAPASAERAHGITLYKKGETKSAVKALRAAVKLDKKDVEAWYYLGLALARENKSKDARKAVEQALRLDPDSAPAHASLAYVLLNENSHERAEAEAQRALSLDAAMADAHFVIGVVRLRTDKPEQAAERAKAALRINPDHTGALLLKSQALYEVYIRQHMAAVEKYSVKSDEDEEKRKAIIAERDDAFETIKLQLREAADSLEKLLRLTPNSVHSPQRREDMETFRFYSRPAPSDKNEPPVAISAREATTRAVVLDKPEPAFTDEARAACADANGAIRLRMVLTADGKVKHIFPIKTMKYGLTAQTVEAARKIKFKPALKDGVPVSQWVVIEYNFRCG